MSDKLKKSRAFENPELFLIIGVCLILISPYLFTRTFGLFSFNSETAAVGDTIGGITAPIVSLIGSVLIYYALKAQLNANRIIFEQFEHQKERELYEKLNSYISDQIKLIREDINSITATETTTKIVDGEKTKEVKVHKGIDGIILLFESILNLRNHYTTEAEMIEEISDLTRVKLILERFDFLFDKCESSGLNEEDEDYLNKLISYTYEYSLKVALKKYEPSRMTNAPTCEKCGEKHSGIPEYIYQLYDKLNLKSNLAYNRRL